jgi:serine/threonine protein phosphatase PrpC
MQDAAVTDELSVTIGTNHTVRFLCTALMDGHGGSGVALYLVRHLIPELQCRLQFYAREFHHTFTVQAEVTWWPKVVDRALQATFRSLHQGVSTENLRSGSTLTLWLRQLQSGATWLALVGDSAVKGIDDQGVLRHLHRIHSVDNHHERKRMAQHEDVSLADGYVWHKTDGLALAMTRAIGDRQMGTSISAEPLIRYFPEGQQTHWILATDGFWDVFSNENWGRIREPWVAARKTKNWARSLLEWRNATFEQHDNTTITVVELQSTG